MNNKYLLKKAGITLAEQMRQFGQQGIYLSRSTIGNFLRYRDDHPFNHRIDIKTSFLCMIARYWGKPLWEFISVDYSLEDRKQDVVSGASPQEEGLSEFI